MNDNTYIAAIGIIIVLLVGYFIFFNHSSDNNSTTTTTKISTTPTSNIIAGTTQTNNSSNNTQPFNSNTSYQPTPVVSQTSTTPTPVQGVNITVGNGVPNDQNHTLAINVTETDGGFLPQEYILLHNPTFSLTLENQSSATDFNCPGLNISTSIQKGTNVINANEQSGIFKCSSTKNPSNILKLLINF